MEPIATVGLRSSTLLHHHTCLKWQCGVRSHVIYGVTGASESAPHDRLMDKRSRVYLFLLPRFSSDDNFRSLRLHPGRGFNRGQSELLSLTTTFCPRGCLAQKTSCPIASGPFIIYRELSQFGVIAAVSAAHFVFSDDIVELYSTRT